MSICSTNSDYDVNLLDIVEPDWISSSFSTAIFRSYIFDIDKLDHIITVTMGIIQSCIAMSENIYLYRRMAINIYLRHIQILQNLFCTFDTTYFVVTPITMKSNLMFCLVFQMIPVQLTFVCLMDVGGRLKCLVK